ncbi:non-homologous end-joining DNA ligase [Streptomyces gobiensis]|uniref:non-homologous end-joining DNA ligase n=1 Tax=Streptomyces gobiensis TaxID=2875706 RepID=UPI001E2C7E92|nr:non-homologous end-joining DNA ligase [Streptomyces gobiensis]UGY94600.1 non-homologous end-joining DNA ligase [Streptomyces gobiensis]
MKLSFGEYEIEVGNADKIFFPEAGISKGELVEYYAKVAETILPYLEGRPVSMKRYPDGIEGKSFYQKEVPDHFPDWIERARVSVQRGNGVVHHAVIRRAADLAYLTDQACVTPHVWLSTTDHLNRPDRMIFDLDPTSDDLGVVRDAAQAIRDVLKELGLASYVMTSGSRGYHVWVPLDAEEDFDAVRDIARGIAEAVVARDPESFTVEQRKDQRGDRLLIDYLRNAYGQTSVPPYAVRARPGAPVATPLGWDELGTGPRDYTIGNVLRRLGQKEDPWKEMPRSARPLAEPRQRLDALLSDQDG